MVHKAFQYTYSDDEDIPEERYLLLLSVCPFSFFSDWEDHPLSIIINMCYSLMADAFILKFTSSAARARK